MSAGDEPRSESDSERLDRNFAELLQELRVAQAGVQILFGFLLSLAFTQRFDTLTALQRVEYLITLVAAAAAVVCFTGPAAAHRLLFRRGLKDFLVLYASRLAAWGLVLLAIAVFGGVVLVVDVVLAWGASVATGGGLAVAALVLWLLVPLRQRRHGEHPEHPVDGDRPGRSTGA